ncbi:START domain-containing protein [Vibrio genomosp. F10]|uniref:START domain-containing protein n=1 Tax=Vibrio genomosp. F10 TaxID=723171 RepID=UPI00084CA7EC|nr:START domain-containing protein [Vibrio genomosp. F10]OEE94169.1 hypothetical protein A1QK_16695 [Vibrio genomosp. F10 str. 9ZD137]
MFVLLLIGSLLLAAPSVASPLVAWQFVKTEDGITLHSRPHTNGLVEIRAQMFITTRYSSFLLLLEDTEHVPNWIDNVKKSQVLKQISPTENAVYTQFQAPWPARDRDMVTYSRYYFDHGAFFLLIKDAPSMLAKQPNYIRISDVKALWKLEKLSNGTTHIEYVAFANPSGVLPHWLINKLSINSALKTFQGLRNEIVHYQNATHPNISSADSALSLNNPQTE